METQSGREAEQEDHNSRAKPVLQNRSDAFLGYTVRMKGLWVKCRESGSSQEVSTAAILKQDAGRKGEKSGLS